MPAATQTLEIDLYSDIICPWCYIGSTRLKQVLDSLPQPTDVTLRYHPYLLDPGIPEGGVDLAARLSKKYGMPAADLFSRPEAAARDLGLPLDFSKVPRTYNTLNAHTLLRHVAPERQAALAKDLFEAYFLKGQDISGEAVLVPLAENYGLAADDVRLWLRSDAERNATLQAAQQGMQLGVRGVPFFVFNGKTGFSGAQPEAIFRQAISEAIDPA
jgi:predicted DsbA family dithiol-disulfide isomerase